MKKVKKSFGDTEFCDYLCCMKIGSTQHLISLNNSLYNGEFLNTCIDDIKEERIIYGYIEDIDNMFDRWENPNRYSGGDETVTVKIGEFHTNSNIYKGMTVKDAVNNRVQQQQTDSAQTDLIPIFCFPIYDSLRRKGQSCADNDFRSYIRIEHTHRAKENGENISGLSKKKIKEIYIEYTTGIKKRTENFPLRQSQKECIYKIIRSYMSGEKYFCIGAKPRFGKNQTLLHALKELEFKNILMISYKPTVFNSLRDDVQNHVDFDGWRYVDYREKRNQYENPYDGITPTVVSASVQLLVQTQGVDNINEWRTEFSEKDINAFRDRFEKILPYVDVLIIDESHFGGHTRSMDNIIDSAKNVKLIIFITGTDSKFKNDSRFNDNNIYEYDYFDECNDPTVTDMPKINARLYEMDKSFVYMCKQQYKTEEFPTFGKLFKTNSKGHFEHPDLVKILFKMVLGKRSFNESGRLARHLNSISPYEDPEIENIDHVVWTLPTVAATESAEKILNSLGLTDFEIIRAAGDGIKDIDVVKGIIQNCKAKHKKTITLVCKRFREGVTVPDWNGVFLFDDISSYDLYIQTMFRVQNPNLNKRNCYVFDYNPERHLKLRYDCMHYHNKFGSDDSNDKRMYKTLNDCMPLVYYDAEGSLYSSEEILNKMIEVQRNFSKNGFEEFGLYHLNESLFRLNSKDIVLGDIFKNVVINNHPLPSETISVSSNGVSGGEMCELEISNRFLNAIDDNGIKGKSDQERFMKLCIEVLKTIPKYLFVCNKVYANIYESLEYTNANIFKRVTSIEMDDFKYLLDNNFINVNEVNCSMIKFFKDKEDYYDSAMYCVGDSNYITEIVSNISMFYTKWIYDKSEEKDIPFSILPKFYV